MPELIHDATGATNLYAVIANTADQRWRKGSTNAYEALTVASWAEYKIALTESPASSYRYPVVIPAGINSPSILTLYIYEQLGGSPAVTDTLIAATDVNWTGTAVSNVINDDVPITVLSSGNIQTITNTFLSTVGLLVPNFGDPLGFVINMYVKAANGAPVPGCEVIITGTNLSESTAVIAYGSSRSNGQIDFRLAEGVYYGWRNHPRFVFNDPQTITVDNVGGVTYS